VVLPLAPQVIAVVVAVAVLAVAAGIQATQVEGELADLEEVAAVLMAMVAELGLGEVAVDVTQALAVPEALVAVAVVAVAQAVQPLFSFTLKGK
jgi:hypothetical protein